MKNDIAIIGMSLRVSEADNYLSFWNNLIEGRESIQNLPYTESAANEHYIARKGIIKNATYFEPQLFGISTAEARLMDPQLRIFLELIWEALEDCGHLRETELGIVSVIASQGNNNTYTEKKIVNNPLVDQAYSEMSQIINHGDDFLATRVSYHFNFTGISYTVQTACSSSLVAISQACALLLAKQCDTAIAGGINLTFPMDKGYNHEQGMILSGTGMCRPFDKLADGTVPSNGGGVVVLKRLADALDAHDHIHAVIKGFAVNNDGKNKVGFAAPSVIGQKQVIVKAMSMAKASPASIDFIEAHGTGTATGDPLELAAISEAYSELAQQKHQSLDRLIVHAAPFPPLEQ